MIIALSGFKQVGKSTASKYLEEKYGFVRHNFKAGLINELKQNFQETLKLLSVLYTLSIDELFDQKPPLMRALMQNYGTEVRRGDNKNYWSDLWLKNAIEIQKLHKHIVVDDLRFFTELEAVKSLKGTAVKLEREDIISGGSHISETEHLLFDFDKVIMQKEGDFETLYIELDKLII